MAVDTHGRWPLVSAALVAPAWAAALASGEALRRDDAWVVMLALPILLTHQTEEWVRPGGFLPFCNERLLGSDRPTWPLTERDGFHAIDAGLPVTMKRRMRRAGRWAPTAFVARSRMRPKRRTPSSHRLRSRG